MNENILDDNLESIDKPFVRTARIQQVETATSMGSIVSLIMFWWDMLANGVVHYIAAGSFIIHVLIFASVIWWRKVSIEFDANIAVRQIVVPELLSILRVLIPLYNGWVILSSVGTSYYLYNYLSVIEGLTNMDWTSFILRMIFSLSMAFLYIYYWRITKQSMDFINK